MYAEHFKFKDLPFQLSPDPRFMFESSQHTRAIAHLKFGLNQGEGFIVVTGEVGAGKTTIIQYLLSTLNSRQFTAATVVTTTFDQENMIRMIASGFGLKQEGRDKASIFRDFEGFLTDLVKRGRRALLFVDEAQNLSVPAIEELRMLSNIQIDGVAPLQLFLLGQPQFRRTMASNDLLQLRQRVIASYHLGPMSETETRDYILHRLNRVGWQHNPEFAGEAFPAIFRYTDGVPRRINTLCSRLLLYCYLEDAHVIDERVVVAVADDLEREFDQILERDEPQPRATQEVAEQAKAVLQVAPAAREATRATREVTPTVREPSPPIREVVPPARPAATAVPSFAPPMRNDAPPIASVVPPVSATAPTMRDNPPAARAEAPAIAAAALAVRDVQSSATRDAAPMRQAAAVARETPPAHEHWREVVDLIESTPVDALASLQPAENIDEVKRQIEPNTTLSPDRSQNQLFKRLLMLILEEYLRGRPEPRGQ